MEQDSLFRYVVRGLFGVVPARHDKRLWLGRLRDAGVFLIDVAEEPSGASALGRHVQNCVDRCRGLAPEAILLIKVTVYDAMFGSLRNAGLPVIDRRVPFPGAASKRASRRPSPKHSALPVSSIQFSGARDAPSRR